MLTQRPPQRSIPHPQPLAVIDPELHEHFPDSESVNRALRAFLTIREELKVVSRSGSKRQRKAA